MDKYKLIKTYPGSPELGAVVDENSPHNLYQLCINEPEFWEKVIEKDYEIIDVRYQHNNEIYTWDGKYFSYQNSVISLESTLKGFIGSKNTGYNIYIHSVKRLSDNVTFAVGDKVKQTNVQHNNTFTITGFEFDVNNEHLLVIGNGGIKLHKIEHCKTPLFTTEDGQDIFEGDIVTFVHKQDLRISGTCLTTNISKKCRIWDGSNGYLQFSTKEKAKEYIVMNKPCLSINDLIIIEDKFAMQGMGLIKKAKELVKERI
jgi:hypothetical protein